MRIADQVNAALHYIRKLQMRHGAVGMKSVALVSFPRYNNVTAKLMNFAQATLCDSDEGVVEEDIIAFAIFVSNLFVDHHSKCFAYDGTVSKEQLRLIVAHNKLHMSAQFPLLEEMLNFIVSREANLAREVDQIDRIFNDLHQVFRESINALTEMAEFQQAPRNRGQEALEPTLGKQFPLRDWWRPAHSFQPASRGETQASPFPAQVLQDNLETPSKSKSKSNLDIEIPSNQTKASWNSELSDTIKASWAASWNGIKEFQAADQQRTATNTAI
jgi:hypothetical protein